MLRFEFVHSPLYLLPCALLAVGAAWWMYARQGRRISARMRWVLMSLRVVSLFILLALLIEPVLTALFDEQRPPVVVLLADDSESILALRDSSNLRKAITTNLEALAEGLRKAGAQVDVWAFGNEAQLRGSADSLTWRQSSTHLSQALESTAEQYRGQNVAAVVMATDGIATAGSSPLFAAERLGLPVHSIMLGDTTQLRDLLIENVVYNEISFLNSETPIRVLLKASGFAGGASVLTLLSNGQALEQRNVNINANELEQEIELRIPLKKAGLQQLELTLKPLNGETNLRNNRKLLFINVLETRIRVALFAAGPHPDVAALYRAFAADPRYEWAEYIHRSEKEFFRSPQPNDYAEADVFVLHNFPATANDRAILDKIYEQCEKRNTPILQVAGAPTRYGIHPKQMERMALNPIVSRRGNESTSEAQMFLDQNYKLDATFRFDDDFFAWIDRAPPLIRPDDEWEPAQGTSVFGRARIKGIELDYPMFALQDRNGWKSAFITGEGIWRWRMHAFTEKDNFQYFDQWFQNIVQWLTTRQDKRRFRVFPQQILFGGQEPVWFRGQVYDATYQPLSGAEIRLTLTTPSGKTLDYFLNEPQTGSYRLRIDNLSEGTYRYKATGTRGGQPLGTDEGAFSIGPSAAEFIRLQADHATLRQMALRTGGTTVSLANSSALIDAISKQANFKPMLEAKRTSRAMHQYILPLLLVIVLLAVEWFLRKRNGLA